MIGIGMSAKLSDFKSLIKYPKAGIFGMISQILFLPTIGFAVGYLLELDKIEMIGILLITLCPSGSGSNIISKMVGGNIALSISLTTLSSIFSLALLPLVLNYYIHSNGASFTDIELPVVDTLIQIFLTSVLPVSIGLYISEKHNQIAEATKKPLKWILPGMLFVVFCLIFIFESGENNLNEMVYFFFVAFVLNVSATLITYFSSKILKIENEQALSIGIEAGLKNSAIGLFIAIHLLQSEIISNLLIAYGMVSFYTTFLLGFGLKKIFK